jgi:hypothetical protein
MSETAPAMVRKNAKFMPLLGMMHTNQCTYNWKSK